MVSAVESTIQNTAAFLKQKLPDHFQSVRLGIICGSGLGGLVDTIDPSTKIEFAYRDIPGFAVSTGRS
jgi:purine-nucleoside phosphorylase